jgi:hypothetical protein
MIVVLRLRGVLLRSVPMKAVHPKIVFRKTVFQKDDPEIRIQKLPGLLSIVDHLLDPLEIVDHGSKNAVLKTLSTASGLHPGWKTNQEVSRVRMQLSE